MGDDSECPRKKVALWNHFIKDSVTKTAECNYCKKTLSFRTTISNLKMHLKAKHKQAFKIMIGQYEGESISNGFIKVEDETRQQQSDGDDDADEVVKLSDIWSYFEQESNRRAHCVVCRTLVGSSYDELKSHLKNHHPKLLLQILQDKDSDAVSNDEDNDNTYTEVVYLEQEAEDALKLKEKPKSSPKIVHKPVKRRERSYFDDYQPSPKRRVSIPVPAKKEDDSDELGAFLKYISCLLKKLPKEVFSQVQVDIINTILKANSSISQTVVRESPSQRIILDNEVPKMSNIVTVSDLGPQTHNYTITVAPSSSNTEEIESNAS